MRYISAQVLDPKSPDEFDLGFTLMLVPEGKPLAQIVPIRASANSS